MPVMKIKPLDILIYDIQKNKLTISMAHDRFFCKSLLIFILLWYCVPDQLCSQPKYLNLQTHLPGTLILLQMKKRERKKVERSQKLLPNDLHKLHPPATIHLRPHRERHPNPPAQKLALPLHLTENSNVSPRRVAETRFYFEI
jgi:hypothetical protein